MRKRNVIYGFWVYMRFAKGKTQKKEAYAGKRSDFKEDWVYRGFVSILTHRNRRNMGLGKEKNDIDPKEGKRTGKMGE